MRILSDFRKVNIIDSWIKMVHALETMAHLEDKDHMTIYTLTASEFELAGEGLSAFLGFLDKQYRFSSAENHT